MAQEHVILKAQEQFVPIQDSLRQACVGGVSTIAPFVRRAEDVGYGIGGLQPMGTKHPWKKSQRPPWAKGITYLENNRSYLRYDVCLAQGYPIGSGVVEGACRHVVQDRRDGTGMRGRISGAQSMLHLRAIHRKDDGDAFQRYRIQTATRQLYPYRPFVCRLHRKTA